MFIVTDDIDGSYYIDLILNADELKRIQRNEMVSGEVMIRKKKFYLGIRLKGNWDYEEFERTVEGQEEDREGF